MEPLRIGDLRHRIEVRKENTSDATGEKVVEGTSIVCARYASIETLSGRELEQAQTVEADTTHRIRTWADSQTLTIIPKWQVWFRDPLRSVTRVFNLLTPAMDPWQTGREVFLLAKEQV